MTPAEKLASDAGPADLETLLELGSGGMATAYLARATGPGGFERLVVLKRLSLDLLGNHEARRRFLMEARLAACLHHVNVVGTHHIGRDAAGPFIVLDYVEGGSLDDLVDAARERGTRLATPVVLRVAMDALAGLAAAHAATDSAGRRLNILHRDVSLQNVLVGVHDGVARLSDFGVARSSVASAGTSPGCFVGKVLYFPPEYLRQEPVGPRLDVYALGVTLWQALTGEELWAELSNEEIVRAISEQGVPPLGGRVDVAPDVDAFVARACARDPRDRFDSAAEMLTVLSGIDGERGRVASHAEVARCVGELLGERLRQRRLAVARMASRSRSGVESIQAIEVENTIPLARAQNRAFAGRPAPPVQGQRAPRAKRWRFAPALVGVVALPSVAVLLARESAGPTASASASHGEPASAPTPRLAPSHAPVPAPSAELPSVRAPADASSNEARSTKPEPKTPEPRSQHEGRRRAPVAAAPPSATLAHAVTPASEPAPPLVIRKANPYRREDARPEDRAIQGGKLELKRR